jgi:transient receptor potential cation channel subfamily M protein 3
VDREFASLAFDVLDHSYRTDDDVTQQLLTYRLKLWSDETCLSLAHTTSLKEFIAHPCCQMLLSEMWMGALRVRRYTQLRVSSNLAMILCLNLMCML